MAQYPPQSRPSGPWPAKQVRLRPVPPPREAAQRPPRQLAVVSPDPELVTTLQAEYGHLVAARRFEDPSGMAGPAGQAVEGAVLDVGFGQRRAAYETVRRHYDGWLVILVNADEAAPELPDDPRCIVLGRPFGTADLLELVAALPPPQHSDPERPTAGKVKRGVPIVLIRRPGSNLPPPADQEAHDGNLDAAEGADSADGDLPPPARQAHRRTVGTGRRLGAAAAIGLLALLVWFGAGLVKATQDVKASAEAVRLKLERANAALDAGRLGEAEGQVRAATVDLGRAEAGFAQRQVRVASHLPLLAGPVQDLGHFLGAARHMLRAADNGVLMYQHLGSERRTVLRDGGFDLAALSTVTGAANGLATELAAARADLLQVHGGLLQPGAKDAKASGLRELDNLEGRVLRMVTLLRSMPSLLGVGRSRLYLVVMTNPAELRPAGGVPSAAVRVLIDDGAIGVRDAVSAADDPWRDGTALEASPSLKADSSPHFPTSGEALLRAYEAMTGVHADGVISVDPLAMRAFLRATGPVSVPGYGLVTADNVGRLTMQDAYRRWPDERIRARYNQGLFNTLLRQLLDGQGLLTKARALGTEASERHLQVYMRDTTVQPLVEASAFGGTLDPGVHDYLAVYTQNLTGSNTDYHQRRAIRQLVQLRPEGSAEVTRTVKLSNPSGGSASASMVTMYLPQDGSLLSVRVDGQPRRPTEGHEAGRPFVRVRVRLAPGTSVTVDLRYRAQRAATRMTDGRLRYELVADIQPMVQSPTLEVEVQAPPRMLIESSPGWSQGAGSATLRTRFVKGFRSHIVVRPDW